MSFIGAALAGLSSIGGLLGLGNKQTSTQVNNTTTTTPNLSPQDQSLQHQLIAMYQSQLGGAGSGAFGQAYTTAGLKNINTTQGQTSQAISDFLASRGLGRTTAGAGTLTDTSLSGANQTANFLNSVPLTLDQRLQQIMGAAGNYQASIPVGTTVNQSGTVASQSGAPTGLLGAGQGGVAGLATILGQQSAQNSFQGALNNIFGTQQPSAGNTTNINPPTPAGGSIPPNADGSDYDGYGG